MANRYRHRNKAELARDRRREADMYLQGRLQGDIAKEIGINVSTVCRDLKFIQGEWLKSTLVDFDAAKSKELAEIDLLEREYWQAWTRSCEIAQSAKTTKRPIGEDGEIATVNIERTSKAQVGDPRFLQGVQWCIERRCKIIGIDSPEKHEISGPDGKSLKTEIVFNVEELYETFRILQKANIGEPLDTEKPNSETE